MTVAWTLREPVSGVSARLTPAAGDIMVTEPQVSAVMYGVRGSSPFVVSGARRAATPRVPELIFETATEWTKLRTLRELNRRMVLTADTGEQYPVKIVGDLVTRVIDTPDRARKPLRYVTLNLVGVA